jgi:hypothetical protein
LTPHTLLVKHHIGMTEGGRIAVAVTRAIFVHVRNGGQNINILVPHQHQEFNRVDLDKH